MKKNKINSAAAQALSAAGDYQQAKDVGALDEAMAKAMQKSGTKNKSLVERLIYENNFCIKELTSGANKMQNSSTKQADKILQTALSLLEKEEAFSSDKKLSENLRKEIAKNKGYGFTIPTTYKGAGLNYSQLAILEENLAKNGLGALAVELSGQLTIGASSLLGYGTDEQKAHFLPMLSEGKLLAFALTEVGVGVNAKKIQTYVTKDEKNKCMRLFAKGGAEKLYITSATYGSLVSVVARIGENGKRLGLFIVELPKNDIDNDEYKFKCKSSNSDAFTSVINSKIEFDNFPIPLENEIKADGVEVLFYCLAMGRCMLAAMCAGYQQMLATDCIDYAKQRLGVGGYVFKHELPRHEIAKILGGALTSQALAHLSLNQNEQGNDLAGLRDISKSYSANACLKSLISAEKVIGGRSFDKNSRISEARSNIHVFSIVEGENDLILMGMVKDITSNFTSKYLGDMLGAISKINTDPNEEKILRIDLKAFLKFPARCLKATSLLAFNPSLYKLALYIIKNGIADFFGIFGKLKPLSSYKEYDEIPQILKPYVHYARKGLRKCRWTYLGISLYYQLKQIEAQIPLRNFGKKVELLTAMLALCAHASKLDESQQKVAAFGAQNLKDEIENIKIMNNINEIEKLRGHIKSVGDDINSENYTFTKDIKAQKFAHDWR